MSGIDPEEYTGFAFGVGLERIALLNMRLMTCAFCMKMTRDFWNSFKEV